MSKRENSFKHEQRLAKAWAKELSCKHGIAAWPDTVEIALGDASWKVAAVAITLKNEKGSLIRLWAMVNNKRDLHPLELHAIQANGLRYAAFSELKALLTKLGLVDD